MRMLTKISKNSTTYKLEANENEYKYWFSSVFNYDSHITPHKIVAAVSPTGSGKTKWVNDLVAKSIKEKSDLTILIIENRRARVDQTIKQCVIDLDDDKKMEAFVNSLSFGGNLNDDMVRTVVSAGMSDLLPEQIKMFERKSEKVGTVYNQHACITAAKLASFIDYVYSRSGEQAYFQNRYSILWDLFDLIIIDEVHSIVTDSSYQEAPFYSYDLMTAFDEYCNDSRKHLMVMTATMEPLQNIIKTIKNLHIYDFTDICGGPKPKVVSFIDQKDVKKDIEANYLADPGWHCVYFFTWPILTAQTFCEGTSINPKDVTASFSKEELRKMLEEDGSRRDEYDRMVEIEEDIARDDKDKKDKPKPRVFLVSGKYKEGVDFNWFINTVYVANHVMDDVIQMSGRARLGGHELKIIIGSNEFYKPDDFKEEEVIFRNDKKELKRINDLYNSLGPIEKKRLVKFVTVEDYDRLPEDEPYHPYIRFSCFRNHFCMYDAKHECMKYLKEAFFLWHKKIAKFKPEYYQKIVSKWFPGVQVEPYYSREFLGKQLLDKYVRYTNRLFTSEKKDNIETALCEIWGEDHKINWFVDKIYTLYKIERDEATKKYRFVKKTKENECEE